MKAHPTEASRSENRRKVYKKPRNPKACTWCHQNKRECDRNWESDKKCSQCEGWNSECTPHHPKSRKSKKGVDTTGISYPAIPEVPQAEPHLSIDLASGESPHYGGFEQPPACNVPQNMSMASAIEWANLFFGGVFDQSRFKQRSWLPRDVGDDHEYFGIMLLRVLDLFGEEIGGDKLRKATQAYGEESALPTLATVMATMMLSHQLPSSRHQFANDLLNAAYGWLDSCDEHTFLRNVARHKIKSLLSKVRALAKERNFKLRIHSNRGTTQRRPSGSPRRGKKSQPAASMQGSPANGLDSVNSVLPLPSTRGGPSYRPLPSGSQGFVGPSNDVNSSAAYQEPPFQRPTNAPLAGVYHNDDVDFEDDSTQHPTFGQDTRNPDGHSLPEQFPNATFQSPTHPVGNSNPSFGRDHEYRPNVRQSNSASPNFPRPVQHQGLSFPLSAPSTCQQPWALAHDPVHGTEHTPMDYSGGSIGPQMGCPNTSSWHLHWNEAGGRNG